MIAALTALTGAIHVRLYGHDVFFLLDNGWRALNGQRVHVDYSSAWGPLTFLLIAGGLAVSGGSVAAVSYANAFVAAIAGLWGTWFAIGRSRTLTATAFGCFVALLVAPPFAIGDAPIWTSHAMVYNRYGYALVTIILLECLQPASEDCRASRRKLVEPTLTGCALGLLLFLKITYFLVALPVLCLSVLFRTPRRARAISISIGFFMTAVAFLLYLRFDIGAMWRDLLMAAAARRTTLGLRAGISDVLAGAVARAAPLFAVTFWCRRLCASTASPESLWRGWCYPLAAVLVVAADSLLLLTNSQVSSYPLTAALALVLLSSIETVSHSSASARSSEAAWIIVLSAWLFAFPLALVESVGLGYGLIDSRGSTVPPTVLKFESPRLRPLVLYDVAPDNPDRFSDGREYVSSINEGVRLLTAHTSPTDKVTNLDMFNPFAYALGREPIRGGIAAAAYQYTIDDRHHPSPSRFFADATVVMVPKYPAAAAMFYDGYRRIYEPTLAAEFRLEIESPRWRLYRRMKPQAPGAN